MSEDCEIKLKEIYLISEDFKKLIKNTKKGAGLQKRDVLDIKLREPGGIYTRILKLYAEVFGCIYEAPKGRLDGRVGIGRIFTEVFRTTPNTLRHGSEENIQSVVNKTLETIKNKIEENKSNCEDKCTDDHIVLATGVPMDVDEEELSPSAASPSAPPPQSWDDYFGPQTSEQDKLDRKYPLMKLGLEHELEGGKRSRKVIKKKKSRRKTKKNKKSRRKTNKN